ncbi:MAG: AAA family ATPase, partial [Lachnospiraceae bacterium]|nr:AAA family ATPase [Lachnospiraceae bacterium]
MELKRVEIVGFKSFPDRVEVAFDKGITAIVGPNGSGKSNIADAVRWVLGEQSAKTLRGSKMEDVIFAGTARRKPLGLAEVTLVLDNRDKQIPLDYDEIKIRRRLFRSGESEYSINDGKCRLKDITELLLDTGIGKDGYSLIGQGQIDRLLSSKPQDRRLIFEEAAGINKFKIRREEAEKKLNDQEQQLLRIQDILGELSSREESLKAQAETAEVYLKLKDELKLYEVSAFIGEFDQLQAQHDKVKEQMDDLQEQINASREKQNSSRELSDQLSREASEARAQLDRMNESLREMMLEQEKAEGDRRVLESGKAHHQDEMNQLNARIEDLKRRMKDREDTLRKEQEKIAAYGVDIDAKTDALLDLQIRIRSISDELTEKQQQLDKARKESSRLAQEMVELQMDAQRRDMQTQQEQKDSESYAAEKEDLTLVITKTGIELARIEEQRSVALDSQLAANHLLEECGQNLVDAEKLIRSIKEKQEADLLQMKDLSRKLQWLRSLENEYEGFSGPVRFVMKQKAQFGRRIRGTVSDILKIDQKYMIAMENVLGAQVQNIVVEDTNTAKRLVEQLRRSEGGRATFLPLDAVT